MKKLNYLFVVVFSLIIIGFLLLSAFFCTKSFKNNYIETVAKDNATVAGSVVNQLEYTLKYGKTLDNYYGIGSVFEELRRYCTYAEQICIVDTDGRILYADGDNNPTGAEENSNVAVTYATEFQERFQEVKETDDSVIWSEGDMQQLLLPIKKGEVVATLLIIYKTDSLKSRIAFYEKHIYKNAVLASVIGILLFYLLFFIMRKSLKEKQLKGIMIPVILMSNIIFVMFSYGVFQKGYIEITHSTADTFGIKITRDIERVVSQGVPYRELYKLDTYFDDILRKTKQLGLISLEVGESSNADAEGQKDNTMVYDLKPDSNNQGACLYITPSEAYINSKLRELILRVSVSVITSLMIAGEVISFLLTLLMTEKKGRKKTIRQKQNKTYQPIGIVRGLSFFFAMFQYMAMAFVSIVLASIYKPIEIFGYRLPYDIVMGLPLSIQIFTSLFTAWLSGHFIGKKGWKPVAVTGVLIMSFGTLAAAASREPYLFLVSQVIIGTGLGLARTAFDIYAVLCASNKEMERYTANSNAGIIVGMSCSSAIGAVIAESFGYSGAYFVMGIMGCVVAFLVIVLGLNIMEGKEYAETTEIKKVRDGAEKKQGGIDLQFIGYLMFMVLPYFFIMMFVDYFFPVYANQQGMSTELIGYVFLIYGIVTTYLGVPMCTVLAKRFSSIKMMTIFLGFIGIGILLFSAWNNFFLSVVLVMVIAISDGVMPSQQFKYVYSLPFSKRRGFSKAISIEGIFSSGIRGIAPIIFGYVMTCGNMGLFVVAVLMVACVVMFIVMDGVGKRKEGKLCAEKEK